MIQASLTPLQLGPVQLHHSVVFVAVAIERLDRMGVERV